MLPSLSSEEKAAPFPGVEVTSSLALPSLTLCTHLLSGPSLRSLQHEAFAPIYPNTPLQIFMQPVQGTRAKSYAPSHQQSYVPPTAPSNILTFLDKNLGKSYDSADHSGVIESSTITSSRKHSLDSVIKCPVPAGCFHWETEAWPLFAPPRLTLFLLPQLAVGLLTPTLSKQTRERRGGRQVLPCMALS